MRRSISVSFNHLRRPECIPETGKIQRLSGPRDIPSTCPLYPAKTRWLHIELRTFSHSAGAFGCCSPSCVARGGRPQRSSQYSFPQSLISFFFLLGLFLYFRPAGLHPVRAVATGLVFGMLLLTAPAFICVIAILCVTAFFERKRHHGIAAVLLLVTTLVVITPWQIRNYLTFHRNFFISTNGGFNLLLGNSEHTRPNTGSNIDFSKYEEISRTLDEAERNNYHTREALKYMRQNPGRTVTMYVRKFLNYFDCRNELKMKSEQRDVRTLLVFLAYATIMIFVLVRVLQARRFPLTRFEHYAVWLYVLNGAFAALFVTRIRFRIPFDYLMFSLAAIQFSMWLTRHAVDRESAILDRSAE